MSRAWATSVFHLTGDMLMDGARSRAWSAMLDRLRATARSGESVLFHGTSSFRAARILEGGFDPSTSWVPLPTEHGVVGGAHPCVFWTPLVDMAVSRALRPSPVSEGFPVILSAPVTAVVASGRPVPDYCAWEIDHDEDPGMLPVDWQDSLDKLGAIAVLGCRQVRGLELHAVAPLEERPDGATVRAAYDRLFALR